MNKKIIVSLVAAAVVAGLGITVLTVYSAQADPENGAVSSPPQNKDGTPSDSPAPSTGKAITVTGKTGCLTHKDTSGVVDMSCAIGLTGDDGSNYALSADDPMVLSGATGQQVKVTGTFIEQSSRYDSIGTIKVDTLENQ